MSANNVTLTDITGKARGIVIYGNEYLICDWSQVAGLPQVDSTGAGIVGLDGLGEGAVDAQPVKISPFKLTDLLEGKKRLWDPNNDILDIMYGEFSNSDIFMYALGDAVVIIFSDWE